MTDNKAKNQNPNESPAPESPEEESSARGRLLEVATKLFVEKGLEETTTRDIAKEAGLNISLISYYFGGKEGLYRAVLDDFAEKASSEMKEMLSIYSAGEASKERFGKQMKFLITRIMKIKLESPSIFILLQREVTKGLPYAREIFEKKFQFLVEAVVSVYRDGQKKGFVRKDINPYIVFFSLVHSTDMYLQMCRCNVPILDKIYVLPEQLDEYVDDVYKIFVEGVLV